MFVHLTKQTKFLVRVRSFIKRTNTNKLPAEGFTSCSLSVRFVCSPTQDHNVLPCPVSDHDVHIIQD
ncbi:hypothetical protein Hanom_Chr12g01113281 [Helianthus anomalus]